MKQIFSFLILIYFFSAHASEFKKELSSPVTTKAAPYFWTGAGITLALVLTEDIFSDPASREINKKKPLGDLSKIGDLSGQMYPNALYLIGMAGYSYFADNELSYTRAEHMAKATLYSAGMATLLKYTIREPRPDNSKEKNSFPSGHTTTAFAFAGVVASQHEWYWGTAAIALASLSAISRVNDGRHFYHDVAGGLTLGLGYGIGLKYTLKDEGKLAISPIYSNEERGLRVVYAF